MLSFRSLFVVLVLVLVAHLDPAAFKQVVDLLRMLLVPTAR